MKSTSPTKGKSRKSALYLAIMALGAGVAVQAGAQTPPPATAPAAETGSDAAEGIEEVVVTARRMEERAQDVPISMTIFNQQQLTERNIISSAELATYTPSLASQTEFGSESASFAIRGFRQELATTASVAVYFADVIAPRGGGFVNTGGGAGPGSFFDLQNVQVLKGPQGTLFGRNTDGGAILLVPQKPTSQLEGYLDAGYGNYGMFKVQGVLNVPVSDVFRLRFGVDHENRDGYLKNISGVGPSNFNDIGYTAARMSAVWNIAANVENYTVGSYVKSDRNGDVMKLFDCNPQSGLGYLSACAQLAQGSTHDYYTVQNDLPFAKITMQQWQLVNTTSWNVSDNLTVKNIASYARLTNTSYNDVFGTNFKMPATLGAYPDPYAGTPYIYVNVITAPGHKINDMADTTEELQFQGDLYDKRLTWQAGAYAEFNEPQTTPGVTSAIAVNCNDVLTLNCFDVLGALSGHPGDSGSVGYQVGRTRFHDYGIYEQASYSLTSKLKLTEGLRYTLDSSTSHGLNAYYRFPDSAPSDNPSHNIYCWSSESPYAFKSVETSTAAPSVESCPVSYQQNSKALTWVLGADYKPIDSTLLYLKYSRGYRQGSVATTAAEGYNIYKPEKVDTYEIGSKTSFNGFVHGTFDVAAFYNDFTDQQLSQAFLCPSFSNPNCGAAPSVGIVNAGKSRIYGVEVESTIAPFKGATLAVSYAYLNSKLISIVNTPLPTSSAYYGYNCSYDAEGNCTQGALNAPKNTADVGGAIPLTPKNKVTGTASYVLPLASGLGRLSVAANYTYVSGVIQVSKTESRDYHTAGYGLTNLNLDWTAIAGSQFDAGFFATNVFDQKYQTIIGGAYYAVGFETTGIGEPRMFGGRIRLNFGG